MRTALRRLRSISFLLPLALVTAGAPVSGCSDTSAPSGCCKVCKGGKACGDSCISKSDTCNKGVGCACNG